MMHYIKTALLMFVLVVAASVQGQVTASSADQLAALKRAKTDSLTAAKCQQLLDILGIKLPVLPDMATDPNRPANVTQKNGAGSYSDEQGRHCPRSPWGGWISYDENIAKNLSLIHISEPTRLGMISYAVFCLK